MVVIIRRNQEEVVPDFVLRNLVLHRFPGKHQSDAGVVLYVLTTMVAVVHLKLQVRACRNSEREPGGRVSARCPGR